MEDISLHILDIAENSFRAGAGRVEITVVEDLAADRLTVEIVDDGKGMDARMAAQVTDPFVTTRTTRTVGLGLPLFAQAAQEAGGRLVVESELGRGTRVFAEFEYGHIDRKPIGDISETLVALICGYPALNLQYRHLFAEREFVLDLAELRGELEEVPLDDLQVVVWLRSEIHRALEELRTTPELA